MEATPPAAPYRTTYMAVRPADFEVESLRDKVTFIEKVLTDPNGRPCKPHEAQLDLLRNIASLTVAVTGRQWGKTTAMGWDATWFAVTHRHRKVYIIAPSLDQARIMFDEVAAYFRKAPLSALVEGKVRDYPFPYIKLKNGTEIHARGANSPQYIRGKRAHRAYVDEAAFIKDTVVDDVIEPMFTVTGSEVDSALVLISTPFGQGKFYDLHLECLNKQGIDPTNYRYHNFPSASNPYADKARLQRIMERVGKDSLTWKTEYLGQFADSDLRIFGEAELLAAAERMPHDEQGNEYLPAPYVAGHRYAMGVDLANMRDWFVSVLLDATNPLIIPAKLDRFQKKGYAHYKGVIRDNWNVYGHPETLIDATSLGENFVEELNDISAGGFKFSSTSKYDIVHELAGAINQGRLALPNDPNVLSEFRNFEYVITAAKNLKMEAKRGHDDIVMAFALATRQALTPQMLGWFSAVNSTPGIVPPPRRSRTLPGEDPFAILFKED